MNTGVYATKSDVKLLEQQIHMQTIQLNKLTELIEKLVEVEKDQLTQGMRIGNLELTVAGLATKADNTKTELDKWVQRGIGLWATLTIVTSIFLVAIKLGIMHLGV